MQDINEIGRRICCKGSMPRCAGGYLVWDSLPALPKPFPTHRNGFLYRGRNTRNVF